MTITDTFARFVKSEQSGGIVLIASTAIALALTNSALGPTYLAF